MSKADGDLFLQACGIVHGCVMCSPVLPQYQEISGEGFSLELVPSFSLARKATSRASHSSSSRMRRLLFFWIHLASALAFGTFGMFFQDLQAVKKALEFNETDYNGRRIYVSKASEGRDAPLRRDIDSFSFLYHMSCSLNS